MKFYNIQFFSVARYARSIRVSLSSLLASPSVKSCIRHWFGVSSSELRGCVVYSNPFKRKLLVVQLLYSTRLLPPTRDLFAMSKDGGRGGHITGRHTTLLPWDNTENNTEYLLKLTSSSFTIITYCNELPSVTVINKAAKFQSLFDVIVLTFVQLTNICFLTIFLLVIFFFNFM